VGWYQGKMEWGPRALGNRSILADPRNASMKDILNEKIKHRESFRPFAPSVLEEYASDFFDIDIPSPYMLMVTKVKKPEIIPAVTHVDGTSRLQTVSNDANPLYYDLINEFYKITGVPVIINTSMNVMGEPIVNTPEQAFQMIVKTDMDCLVMGNNLIFSDG
jgi:carbamoyltransferase